MKNKTEINFTKATLLELPIPEKGTLTFCDTKEKGLSLYVTSTGHKSFMVRKRIQGQDKRVVLGHFPDMTVELARKAAQKIKGQLAEGKNPCEEKEKLAAERTFGEAYEMYMDRHVRVENKPSALKDIKFRMGKVLPCWGERRLSSITRQEVQG
ncbi:MAG: Arm DNA-binding domain-containing protein, partial [Puniceicoccales bacterium]|nr:Arm DNA-binding domain-containing protein [Puniceicoccales bacterium]